jgi:hypothetical protein
VHHLGIVFRVEAHDGELRHEVNGSTDRCAWIPLAYRHALPLVPLASLVVRHIPGQGSLPTVTAPEPGAGR